MWETAWKSGRPKLRSVHRPDADADAARSESGVLVTRLSSGTIRVELWGLMPVGWLGNFTRGATRMNLSILRGVARRGAQRRWTAEFELRESGDLRSEPIDFLALAREPSESPAPVALELAGFELVRSRGHLGALDLRIRARDRVGFLASLLEHLAGFVLFPEEIGIETALGEARDSLSLSSVGGQSPPPEIEGALRKSLQACMQEGA